MFQQITRPEKYKLEQNDCTVVAVSKACGFTYEDSYRVLRSMGRQSNQPFRLAMHLMFLTGNHSELLRAYVIAKSYKYTTAYEFVQQKLPGSFLLVSDDHIMTCTDGVLYGDDRSELYKPIFKVFKIVQS